MLFSLEIEFKRKGSTMSRDDILKRYINHPYFERYMTGKVSKNLAQMVELVDSGEADALEKSCSKHDPKKAVHRSSISTKTSTSHLSGAKLDK